jgi:hypothetical protein
VDRLSWKQQRGPPVAALVAFAALACASFLGLAAWAGGGGGGEARPGALIQVRHSRLLPIGSVRSKFLPPSHWHCVVCFV